MGISLSDLVEFQTRLGEAMAWYLSKAPVSDPEHGLRTVALGSPAGLKTPTELAWNDPPRPWTAEILRDSLHKAHRDKPQILKERQSIVDEVARKRRALLNTSRFDSLQVKEVHGIGRLLFYYPDQNLADGAAMVASRGFFDWENVPPWDTWLVYVVDNLKENYTYLIAWVPPECLELASDGVEANPEDCIRWAEDVDAEFVRQLKSAGLLRER